MKTSSPNVQYRYVCSLAVKFFHDIVKSNKYKKAIHLLVKTMDFNLSEQEISEKINKITDILSKIEPILVDGVQLNGMISSDLNFFIDSDFEKLLSHISKEKEKMKGSTRALMCALVRLFIHETTHLIIGFLQSHEQNQYDFLNGTPDKSKSFMSDEKLTTFEGGYRMEEVLIGSCRRIFYDQNSFVDKFLEESIWEDENIPIFSPEELEKMDPITKNYMFSGIDNEEIYCNE